MQAGTKLTRVRVGIAGWSYPDWEGIVFPHEHGRGFDALVYVSSYFDAVELNNTFYRPPTAKMSASWARRVEHNSEFQFTAKAWQQITHAARFTRSQVNQYRQGLEPLVDAERLGCVLLQYPWSFRNNERNRRRLAATFEVLDGLPLAVEVRHSSWDDPELWTLLSDHGVAYCAVDQPAHRDGLAALPRVTAATAYFRLHGRNQEAWFDSGAGRDQRYDYLYDSDELEELAEKMAQMAQSAAGDLYIIANNHYRGQAAANALQLKALLNRLASGRTGEASTPLSAPASLLEAYPELGSIAEADPPADPLQPRLPTDD